MFLSPVPPIPRSPDPSVKKFHSIAEDIAGARSPPHPTQKYLWDRQSWIEASGYPGLNKGGPRSSKSFCSAPTQKYLWVLNWIEASGYPGLNETKALLVMPRQKGYRTHAIFCYVDGIFFFSITGSNGYRRRSLLGRTASIFSHGSN